MIIPVKCFTCGNMLSDKYLWYIKEVRKIKMKNEVDPEEVIYLDETNIKKTAEGITLDKLKLRKLCCRRHMLTHVDII